MQPTAFRYFYAVGRLKSIRKASQQLNVAPSAISRQITLLEHDFEVALIERLARGVRLTDAGEIVFRHLHATFLEQQRAMAWIEEIKGGRRGTVRVATIEGLVSNFLPRVVKSFQSTNPQVKIEILVVGTDHVTDMLRADECEIGLVFQPKDVSELSCCAELASPFCAVMAIDHPLADRKTLSIKDVSRYPVVLSEQSFSSRSLLDRALRASKVSLNVAVETNSIEGSKALARLGIGVIFMPAFAAERERRNGELLAIPLSDPEVLGAKLMVMTRTQRRLSPAANRLLNRFVSDFPTADAP